MISRILQHHYRSLLFGVFMLSAAGLLIAFYLPVTLFPTFDCPRVLIYLSSGLKPADQTAFELTTPVEEAVRKVPGVTGVRSKTGSGSANVSVKFSWGIDMQRAALQVASAVNQVIPSLPAGTSFVIQRMDMTVYPFIAYSLISENPKEPDLVSLHDLAKYELLPLLYGVEGVANVQIVGGALEEYHVTVDPARLKSFGLSIKDVASALKKQNSFEALGRLEDHYKLYVVTGSRKITDGAQLKKLPLVNSGGGMIALEDIARVEKSTVPQWMTVIADGKQAVLLQAIQQIGSDNITIARAVKAKLESYSKHLSSDIHISTWYDQSLLVRSSATSVRDAIFLGVFFGGAILFLFLRNVKITLIALVIVPASLLITVCLMLLFDMSFNIMTLGGMAAAIGLMIDDVIVMSEFIMRRLNENKGQPYQETIVRAAIHFVHSLAGSSGATIVIFIPLAFLTGITGVFFKALSLTMVSGLIISFLTTWLVTPVLAHRFLNDKDSVHTSGFSLMDRLVPIYHKTLRRILSNPYMMFVLIVPLIFVGWAAYSQVGSGFMPKIDEGGFILDYISPPGTSLSETDRLLRQVEDIIKTVPEVETYTRRTGTQLGGGLTEANEGDFFIRLKPLPRRPIGVIIDEVRHKVLSQVPGLTIEFAQLMEDLIGDVTGTPEPIEVKLYSSNYAELEKYAMQIAQKLKRINGVVDINPGIMFAGDTLEIQVDPVKAAIEGMDPGMVTGVVSDYLNGAVPTQLQEKVKMVGVRLWIPRKMASQENQLLELPIRAPDGHLFPLKKVASLIEAAGQPEIDRDNLRRMIAVTARISGRPLSSVIHDVRTMLNQELPAALYYELGGLYAQQQAAFKGLIIVFAAASILVFLLLLVLFEDFRIAVSIILIPLLSIPAVFVGLWLTGLELNISSMMGLTMIIGIVTEMAIFFFSEYQQLVKKLSVHDAIIESGKKRMRPILMTTLTTILTLIPLVLLAEQGAAMHKPLAIAIIFGLLVQPVLILLLMPAIFSRIAAIGFSKSS